MVNRSLNQNIFRLVVGVVIFTSLTIIANVWMATADQAQQRLNRDLNVAQNVLQQVLNNRENLLINSASVLTDDFGFKQAVATTDTGTISSALLNHGQRINADLMGLISLEGINITSTPDILTSGQPFPIQALIEEIIVEGGASAFIVLNQQLYQVIMLTVDAPAPLAIAMVGFKLDKNLVTQLTDITQLQTSIQVFNGEQDIFTVSTLEPELLKQTLSEQSQALSWFAITAGKGSPYVSRQFDITQGYGLRTVITLSEDVNQLFDEFNNLQLNIAAIAALALVLALFFAALFSRKLAKPLRSLADVAQRISTGDYSKTIEMRGNTDELDKLTVAFSSMQSNIQAREKEIIYQAQHDILTSLYNRNHIETILTQKFATQQSFMAVGINIFGFRGINDIFGYHNGDLCLKELAKRVSELGGLAARLTGGELLWVPDKQLKREELDNIKLKLEQPINCGDVVVKIKVAIGLLFCPEDASIAEELFRRMNIVLDEAQIKRQFILRYDGTLEQKYLRRLSIITELKQTLAHKPHELNLFYQPKLNLASGKVVSAEALIRWVNDKLGFVSPEDFIAIAEHAGFIEIVTEWVIDRAIKDAVSFREADIDISIAVNLSARDIMNADLLNTISDKMASNRLPVNSLSFEITEGDLVKDHEKATMQLQAFRDKGFTIAIDDFGTGYSSMAYLQSLPVNTLKVDKSFVLNLNTQIGDQNIVKTVIKLAHSFDMSVVAEGVENVDSLLLLKEWRCEWAQGYYICKPAPINDIIEWYYLNKDNEWFSTA